MPYMFQAFQNSALVARDPFVAFNVSAPTITGPAAVTTPENQLAVATYLIENRNGELPTLAGAAGALFAINLASGNNFNLVWASNPNFEVLGAGPHVVDVLIDDGAGGTDSLSVPVTLTDEDEIAPQPVISFAGAQPVGGAFQIQIDVGETPDQFGEGDYVVTGGTDGGINAVPTDNVYTIDITPPADASGNITININAGAYNDLAGNPNLAATPLVIAFDTLIPDTTDPVITLLGQSVVNIDVGQAYNDAGATALDDTDGDITGDIVVVNPVDINTVGAYTITYNVQDAAGNSAAEVTRSVIVNAVGDTTPDAFVFVDATDVAINTIIISNAVTIQGINNPSPISITGGEYSIDGAPYTSAPGTITNGQQVTVRHTSSANYETAINTVLNVGGIVDTFSSTTLEEPNTAPEISPQTFSISELAQVSIVIGTVVGTDVNLDTLTYSILSGNTNDDIAIDANSGVLTVANALDFATTPQYVLDVEVSDGLLTANANITINVTEANAVVEVDPFDLGGAITFAKPDTPYKAIPVVVSGAPNGVDLPISVANGVYSVDGGAQTSNAGVVRNGQTVEFWVTSASAPFLNVVGTLNIQNESSDFIVVTGDQVAVNEGVSFIVRDRNTDQLITGLTIDVTISTEQFGGAPLYEGANLPIDNTGQLIIPIEGGELGRQVFVSGLLSDGRYIAGNAVIIDITGM